MIFQVPLLEGRAAVTKLTLTVVDFRSQAKNTLIGFAVVRVNEMRLTIKDVAIHQKGDSRWAALPSKPQITKDGQAVTRDGKIQYLNILEFDNAAVRSAFSTAVIAALLDRCPNAFGEAAA